MDDGDADGLISMMMVVMMAIMKALSLLEYSNNFYSKRGKGQWSQSKYFVTQQIAVKQLMYSNWKITDHEGI